MERIRAVCDIALALSLAVGSVTGMLEKETEASKPAVERLEGAPSYNVKPPEMYNPIISTGSALVRYSDRQTLK
jgi:hypothetical protein